MMTTALMMLTLGQVSLYSEIGNDVVLDGAISNVIAQHPIGDVKGKKPVYLDVPGNSQTVAYVPKDFDCKGDVFLEGKVISFEAGGKRQKSEERFRVAHLDVEKWQCLPASIDSLVEAYEKASDKAAAEKRVVELGRAALPGLVRLSNTPSAVALLGKLTGRTSGDWPKWWRARWKKSLEELRAER
jgi:hypothetical protein